MPGKLHASKPLNGAQGTDPQSCPIEDISASRQIRGRAKCFCASVPMRQIGHSRARDWQLIGANDMVCLPS
jgi:hypothetical protein